MPETPSLPPFPVSFNEADCKFILMEHYVRRREAGICRPCQDSILTSFCALSSRHKTGLQLHPSHLDTSRLPPAIAERVDHTRLNMITWHIQNRAAFDDQLHNTWIHIFATVGALLEIEEYEKQALKRQELAHSQGRTANHPHQVPPLNSPSTPAAAASAITTAEEWITKLWFACAGRYTTADLARGRPYAGWPSAFEGMHLRRLVAGQKPRHGDRCKCVDRSWRGPPFSGQPLQNWLAGPSPHTEVLMRYTDPAIRDIHVRICGELVARGDGARAMPLAKMWDQPGFRERLVVAVGELVASKAMVEERKRKEAASALVEMRQGGEEHPVDDRGDEDISQFEVKMTIEIEDDDQKQKNTYPCGLSVQRGT
ncbi:predicted protein [Chaetomium globosum CBS 148.51]|uniref:Uncharacterized protein n=1 Tax=Chaetomium globosum (strain ATCC 6205 / CBS 148.51 / DSM 1962 / NBRC 6347 / NRRL 1970) TaxID=306901 RepID=Q2GUD2_CHAGB|nr:uncharacterized protein CHGG_08422 [Chaetomium globosum CBS 148.51]EAQ84408.1 predicted protein [Chaetomium globosum CBS 148.51]